MQHAKQLLDIRRIRVRKGILDLEVCADIDTLYLTSEQARRVLGLLPNLANHVCVHGPGDTTFGDEIEGTELPHLLEHIIIELQGKAARAGNPHGPGEADIQFTGHTSWLDELAHTAPQGLALMRVSVSFADDFMALHAMNEALSIIAWACGPAASPAPDVEAIIQRLATT